MSCSKKHVRELCRGSLAIVMAAFGVCALRAGTEMPTANGDLASETDWGGQIPLNAEIGAQGNYTFSKDVQFRTFYIKTGSNTFTPANGVTVSFTNESINADGTAKSNSERKAFKLAAGASDTVQTFDGGIWDFTRAHLGIYDYGTTGGPLGAQLLFRNGAVVTNVGTLCVAGYDADPKGTVMTFTGSGTRLHIADNDKLISNGILIGCAGKDGVKGRLEILDGADFYCGTPMYFDIGSDTPHTNDLEFLVSGTGSRALLTKALYMGWGHNNGNRITVDDHGSFTTTSSTFSLGYGGNTVPAISNIVTVKNGATLTANSANIQFGTTGAQRFEGHSFGNQLRVLSGATSSVKGLYVNYGSAAANKYDRGKGLGVYDYGDGTHDNGVLVSNATLTASGSIILGYAAYTYNGWLEALGGSSLSCDNLYIGYGGTNAFNTAEIRDSSLTTKTIQIGVGPSSAGDSVVLSNVVVSTPSDLRIYVGHDATSRDSELTVERCTLPTLASFTLGGSNTVATFRDTPVTVPSGFSGVGSAGISRDMRLTFTGPLSVFTWPASASYWGGYNSETYHVDTSTLTIADGAELRLATTNAEMHVGRPGTTGNTLRIKDGRLTCLYVLLHGLGNTFEIDGADSAVDLTKNKATYSIFQNATNCTYRLTNGARLVPRSYNLYFCFINAGCVGNTFAVENGAMLDMSELVQENGSPSRDFMLGYWGENPLAKVHDNTLLVKAGGVITNAGIICVTYTHNNRLIVDDGQVHCDSISLNGEGGTNNWVIIRGRNALVRDAGQFHLRAGNHHGLRIEVPAGGFAQTPLTVSYLNMPADAKLEIDLAALLPSLTTEKTIQPLIETTTAMTDEYLNPAVLAAAVEGVEAQLAAADCRGRLELSGDRKSLVLTATRRTGLAIFYR